MGIIGVYLQGFHINPYACKAVGRGSGEEAELAGAGHRLGAVGHVQFAVDAGGVGFDGARGDDQLAENQMDLVRIKVRLRLLAGIKG